MMSPPHLLVLVLACLLGLALLPLPCQSDEMAFVDVTATDAMTVRFLDVRVKSKAGIAGLFESDPMITHDWTSKSQVNQTLEAVLRSVKLGHGPVAERVTEVARQLAPLYATFKKNGYDRLDAPAVRYSLHRFFAQRGWHIKGLEPAGSAWTASLPVTSDVRQLTKYIVPGWLLQQLHDRSEGKGLDLETLGALVVVFERLILAELDDYMYSIFMTLELPLNAAVPRSKAQEVLGSFLAVFAFGSDLEVSTKKALEKLLAFLDARHHPWQQLQARVKDTLQGSETYTFATLVAKAEGLMEMYGELHGQACQKAEEMVSAEPSFSNGRLPLDQVKPIRAHHRAFLTEAPEHLRQQGAVASDSDSGSSGGGGESLMLANYLQSREMCLSTASYFAVCCPNKCESSYLSKLELLAQAPSATASQVAEAFKATAAQGESLAELVASTNGKLDIHGLPLARWQHQQYGSTCAQPVEASQDLNPRTANEWLSSEVDDVHETEELMSEMSVAIAKFTTLDLGVTGWEELPEDVEPVSFPVEKVIESPTSVEDFPVSSSSLAAFGQAVGQLSKMGLFLVLLGSMAGVLRTVVRPAIAGRSDSKNSIGKANCWKSGDCIA